MSPPPEPRRRRRIDKTFVLFLFKYANLHPECDPLFREYLLNYVLPKGDTLEKKIEYIYFYLKNWEIKQYGWLSPNFLDELADYDLYDLLFPSDGIPPTGAIDPIPPSYVPKAKSGPPREVFPGPEPRFPVTPDDQYYDSTNLGLYDEETLDRLGARPPTAPAGEEKEKEKPEVGEPARKAPKQKPLPGSLDDLLRLLNRIPHVPSVEGSLRQIPKRMHQLGVEWWNDSQYKGMRQPPIATRLVNVVNFLIDEDVDRCQNWKEQFQDVVDYLYWLGREDESSQIWSVSRPVLEIYLDAIDKAKTHILFQKHNYDPTPLEITKPPKVPLRSTRLDWLGDVHNWPVITSKASAPAWRDLLPRPIYPRPAQGAFVNSLPYEGQVFDIAPQQLLARDEEQWWQADSTGVDDRANLAVIEGKAFDSFSRANQIGWTLFDHRTQLEVLPDHQPVIPGDTENWVKQRAARRAGLQQLLRLYSATDGNAKVLAQNPWQKLVLPTAAGVIRKVRGRADGPQWDVPRLTPKEFGPFVETMPYTISFREHLKKVKRTRMEALLKTQLRYSSGRTWVDIPKNLITGGPFVWRGLDPGHQAAEDLLDLCYTTFKMLKVASQRDPRELLSTVLQFAEEGIEGKYAPDSIPYEVRLATDEYEGTQPKFVTEEDVEWLRFLSTECKSKGNWTGRFVSDEPKDKYKLFHIFATRVQRLLDDKNPDGLFSQHDARVTVEDLLKAINAPSEGTGPQVFRYTFDAVDASCWLDRMRRTGHIKFQPAPISYGIVKRPRVKYYPEHRVIWPTAKEKKPRPTYLGHITSWEEAIEKPTNDREIEDIWNFFNALGFRLGYTIHQLETERYQRAQSKQRPIPLHYLRDSIRRFDKECQKTSGQPGDGLAELVEATNPFQAEELGIKLNPTEDTEQPPPTSTPEQETKALDWIRQKVITEASENLTMLGPGRKHSYISRHSKNEHIVLKYDFTWDWAYPPKGAQRKQFWNINRWPVDSGYLSKEANDAVKNKVVHTDLVYNPVTEDPTDKSLWYMPQQEKFDTRVRHRWGPPRFIIGDTPYQRRIVEEQITRAANLGMFFSVSRPVLSYPVL